MIGYIISFARESLESESLVVSSLKELFVYESFESNLLVGSSVKASLDAIDSKVLFFCTSDPVSRKEQIDRAVIIFKCFIHHLFL